MSTAEKRSLISQLIALRKADGVISEDETALIKRMGNMIGLNDQELLELFKNPAPFNPPKMPQDRITQFHRLVLLMNVDGVISPSEIQHLKLVGIKLGIQADCMEDVLKEMAKYENGLVPVERLMQIYVRHMN